MAKAIQTFTTNQYMDEFMKPDPKLKEMIKPDFGKFFIVRVQDLIKISKLPVPPTRSKQHTLIYLTAGEATMKVGAQPVRITTGQCVVVPAGQVFSYGKYEVNTGFLCVFDSDFLVENGGISNPLKQFEFLNVWGNPVIKADTATARYLKQTLQRVLDEYMRNGLTRSHVIRSYFVAALFDLHEAYRPISASNNKTAVTLTNNFRKLLHKHIRNKHLVTDYAALLHVTPNHLNKVVKETTGKPASKWIDEELITEAKVLLVQTNNSIQEVANELGFFDQSYFTRLFKKYESTTPLKYRKMIEKS